jgi:hypothetical protein
MAIKHEFSYRTIINAVPATVYITYKFAGTANGSITTNFYRKYTLTVEYQQDKVIPDGEASHKRTLKFLAESAYTTASNAIDYAGFTENDFDDFIAGTTGAKSVSCSIPNDTKRNTIYTEEGKTDNAYSENYATVLRHRLFINSSGNVGYDPDSTKTYLTEYMAFPPVRDFLTLTAVNHITDEEPPRFSFKNWKSKNPGTEKPATYGIYNYMHLTFDGSAPVVSREISLLEKETTAEIVLTDEERAEMRRNVTSGTVAAMSYKLDSEWHPEILTDSGHPSIGTSEWVYSSTLSATYTLVDAFPVIATVDIMDTDATTTALTGDSSTIIKYFSDVQFNVLASGKKEGVITDITAENGALKATGATGTLENVEGNRFTFTATDNRGNSTAQSVTMPMVEYIRLSCSITGGSISSAGVCDLAAKGNYFNGSFGAASNTLSVQCRYKTEGGSFSAWVPMTATASGNSYTAQTTINGLDYQAQYIFQVQAIDRLSTATTPETGFVSKPIFYWGKDEFVFETDVQMKGNLRLKGAGNYGNKINLGDGEYVYIAEETDDRLKIRATGLTLDAQTVNLSGTVNVNGYELPETGVQSGTWTPTLATSAAVSYYDTQSGWWQRVGDVVTIGFIIKASCNSGYNSTQLNITGLPYTPAVAAFGGGVAHNIYITGGFCFEGWSADTGGKISARLQPCNGTSAGNLNISSSSNYPSGGGTVTLAGTICYTI